MDVVVDEEVDKEVEEEISEKPEVVGVDVDVVVEGVFYWARYTESSSENCQRSEVIARDISPVTMLNMNSIPHWVLTAQRHN